MSKGLHYLSMTILGLTILGGLHSESILVFWAMLELNMLSFIFVSFVSLDFKEGALKYFLAQSLGSLLLLSWFLLVLSGLAESEGSLLAWLPLGLKLGVPPFHWWLISVFQDLSSSLILVLSTAQKILPFYLLLKLGLKFSAWWLGGALLVSVVYLLSSLLLKKVLAYSSVLSLAWMLGANSSWSSVILFLLVYGLGLSVLLISVSEDLDGVSCSISQKFGASSLKGAGLVALLSMAGVPPLFGFFAKLNVLWSALSASVVAFLVLLLSTPPSLYGYSRFVLLALKLGSPKWGLRSFQSSSQAGASLAAVLMGGGFLLG